MEVSAKKSVVVASRPRLAARTARATRARKLKPLVYKEHFPNYSERSLASSGLNTGVVARGDKRFRELVVNLNPDVKFRDEEGTGADRLMTQVS